MCMCGWVKTHIVTCEKSMFWCEKGYKRIGGSGQPKNTLVTSTFSVLFSVIFLLILNNFASKSVFVIKLVRANISH